jgi:hypothetical protein
MTKLMAVLLNFKNTNAAECLRNRCHEPVGLLFARSYYYVPRSTGHSKGKCSTNKLCCWIDSTFFIHKCIAISLVIVMDSLRFDTMCTSAISQLQESFSCWPSKLRIYRPTWIRGMHEVDCKYSHRLTIEALCWLVNSFRSMHVQN